MSQGGNQNPERLRDFLSRSIASNRVRNRELRQQSAREAEAERREREEQLRQEAQRQEEQALAREARRAHQEWLTRAIQGAPGLAFGTGVEPINPQAVANQGQNLSHDEVFRREISSAANANADPEVNRIAMIFYASLMTMITQEFGYSNPTWERLGWREKKAWLESTRLIIEELQKTPINFAAVSGRRIIES